MSTIVVTNGLSRGNYLSFETRVMTIGRDEDCDMQVLDEKVSRHHIEVRPDEVNDGFTITNVATSNRVLLNKTPIKQSTRLHEGDQITIGSSILVFTTKPIHDAQGALTFAAHGEHQKRTIVDP